MIKEWRPKNWDNGTIPSYEGWNRVMTPEEVRIYEAGAGAMLPAVLNGVTKWLTEDSEGDGWGMLLPSGWGHKLYDYFGLKMPDD